MLLRGGLEPSRASEAAEHSVLLLAAQRAQGMDAAGKRAGETQCEA